MTSEEEDVPDSRRETATLDGSASASRIEHLPYITQGRMALTLSFQGGPNARLAFPRFQGHLEEDPLHPHNSGNGQYRSKQWEAPSGFN